VNAQNYLGEFATAVLAGIAIELVKHRLDKRKDRGNNEPDQTNIADGNPAEQDE
jgi:hypothetical protein